MAAHHLRETLIWMLHPLREGIPLVCFSRCCCPGSSLNCSLTMQSADLICSSVLASFPDVLDQPDLMEAFRRDINVLKQMFLSVYMDSVFPLLYSAEMPAPCWADEEVESQRAHLIYSPSQNVSVEIMLSSQYTHQAFDITQVTYDLISSAQQ